MPEPKNFASLGPTLLARKGGAKPAMRSQWNAGAAAAAKPVEPADEEYVHTQDDLGWNDMGDDADNHGAEVLSLTPAQPGDHYADEEGEEEDASPDEERSAVESILGKRDAANSDMAGDSDVPEVLRRQHSIHAQLAAAGTDSGPLQVKQPRKKPVEEIEEAETSISEVEAKEETKVETKVEAKPDAKPELRAVETPKVAANDAESPSKASKKGGRAAFTLRLDAQRHLKLRLACTIKNCSAQQLVTEALDRFLEEIPEVSSLAEQLKKN